MLKRGKTQRAKSRPKKRREKIGATMDIPVAINLRVKLERAARASGMSLASEIKYRLEKSLAGNDVEKMLEKAADGMFLFRQQTELRRIVREEYALAISHNVPTYTQIKSAVYEILKSMPSNASAQRPASTESASS
jgi:hypothetical protein